MKNFLYIIASAVSLGASHIYSAPPANSTTPSSLSRLGESTLDPASTTQEYRVLRRRLVTEYFETGSISRPSAEAFHLMVGIAGRGNVRTDRVPLRTSDERNLGAALLIQSVESLGMGYDRIYHLKMEKRN